MRRRRSHAVPHAQLLVPGVRPCRRCSRSDSDSLARSAPPALDTRPANNLEQRRRLRGGVKVCVSLVLFLFAVYTTAIRRQRDEDRVPGAGLSRHWALFSDSSRVDGNSILSEFSFQSFFCQHSPSQASGARTRSARAASGLPEAVCCAVGSGVGQKLQEKAANKVLQSLHLLSLLLD